MVYGGKLHSHPSPPFASTPCFGDAYFKLYPSRETMYCIFKHIYVYILAPYYYK